MGGCGSGTSAELPFSADFLLGDPNPPDTPMAVASDSVRAGSLGVQVPENHTF
jgi:hypothetical protein